MVSSFGHFSQFGTIWFLAVRKWKKRKKTMLFDRNVFFTKWPFIKGEFHDHSHLHEDILACIWHRFNGKHRNNICKCITLSAVRFRVFFLNLSVWHFVNQPNAKIDFFLRIKIFSRNICNANVYSKTKLNLLDEFKVHHTLVSDIKMLWNVWDIFQKLNFVGKLNF